jgi:plasmid stabilization system protein ParE
MAKVIWSPSSLDDIDTIAKFISKDSVYHASLFIDRLFEVTDRLKEHPLSGRVIPEITGVIHGARNWKPPVF